MAENVSKVKIICQNLSTMYIVGLDADMCLCTIKCFCLFQDKVYKNLKQPCEINPDCLAKRGAAQAICIRHCISSFCYNDIYGDDPVS